jgi:hypothetical protein
MLIGCPLDYRSNEEIGDTIKSFGRLYSSRMIIYLLDSLSRQESLICRMSPIISSSLKEIFFRGYLNSPM